MNSPVSGIIARLTGKSDAPTIPRRVTEIPDVPPQIDQAVVQQLLADEVHKMVSMVLDVSETCDGDVEAITRSIVTNQYARQQALNSLLWQGFVNSGRVRFFGHTGLTSELDPNGWPFNGYAHFGAELWTRYPYLDSDPEREERNRSLLTRYAMAAAVVHKGM